MTYTIKNADGSTLTTIQPQTTNTTSTSLALPGYAAPGWGAAANQNFLYLLQNFASPNAPANPIPGQMWFNNNSNDLQIYTTSGWIIVATATWLADQGYITEENLTGYATVAWVEQQSFVTSAILETYSYVTASYISSQSFVTSSTLFSQEYVTQVTVNNSIAAAESSLSSGYVSETYFAGQSFVTSSALSAMEYVTESYITGQSYVTETMLSGYLTANQEITLSGDATGSGTTAITVTLASTGVTPGTYTAVSVDAKGRVLTGGSIQVGDITSALGFLPLSTSDFEASLSGSNGYQMLGSGLIIQWVTGTTDPADDTTPTQAIPWALTFPNALIGASVSTYIASGTSDDLWYQVISSGSNTTQVSVQRQAGSGTFGAETTPFIIGFGY